MVHAAPFQGLGRALSKLSEEESLQLMQEKLVDIVTEFDPGGQSQTLGEIADVARRALGYFASVRNEGYHHWAVLYEFMRNGRADLIAFAGWGRFGEKFAALLTEEFAAGHYTCQHDDPVLGLQVLRELLTDECPPHPSMWSHGYEDTGDGESAIET